MILGFNWVFYKQCILNLSLFVARIFTLNSLLDDESSDVAEILVRFSLSFNSLVLDMLLIFFYIELILYLFDAGINHFHQTPNREWFETDAVLRVSLGNFLFFTILSILMIGVKNQRDPRDSLHHGGWMMKIICWCLLVIFMFFLPNEIISFYGKIYLSNFLLLLFIFFTSGVDLYGSIIFYLKLHMLFLVIYKKRCNLNL